MGDVIYMSDYKRKKKADAKRVKIMDKVMSSAENFFEARRLVLANGLDRVNSNEVEDAHTQALVSEYLNDLVVEIEGFRSLLKVEEKTASVRELHTPPPAPQPEITMDDFKKTLKNTKPTKDLQNFLMGSLLLGVDEYE